MAALGLIQPWIQTADFTGCDLSVLCTDCSGALARNDPLKDIRVMEDKHHRPSLDFVVSLRVFLSLSKMFLGLMRTPECVLVCPANECARTPEGQSVS